MTYTTIANPIYDSVFKFLMEDERAAKVILSALLQREVRSLVIKRNEYTKATKDDISVFRIDFAATVVDNDGKEELITIEMQKAWLPSEVARFRKYLANQYSDETNSITISTKPERKQPLHTVTVYLLGHKVEELPNAVTYVYPKMYDQYNNELGNLKISKIPFVDALIHDMIIVQIPLLTNMKVVSHLDRLLSLFDQSYVTKENSHKMNLNTEKLSEDKALEPVVNRLQCAYVDNETRENMEFEDEYTRVLEDFEQQIANKNQAIAQKDEELEKMHQLIKNSIIGMRDSGLSNEAIAKILNLNLDEVKTIK